METDSSSVILDGGVLIALVTEEASAKKLSQRIISGETLYFCTEIAMSELVYIVCRKSSWKVAKKKSENLLNSGAIRVIPTEIVWKEAAKIKCKAPISLPDCYTIAGAVLLGGMALFVHKEKEIDTSLERGLLPDVLTFLR